MPILVFLHGLLGTQADWEKVRKNLPLFSCVCLDLPLHGSQKDYVVTDFEQTCTYLSEQIAKKIGNQPYFLVGYSLGGRIALYYGLQAHCEKHNLQGLILEGANLGLQTAKEKQARWQNDLYWAQRFAQQSPEIVLDAWYQQPVFAHLTDLQREQLIALRRDNCGENIAQMLQATSLAKQPDFRALIQSTGLAIYYFCGEWDQKFRKMALENQLNLTLISQAGHNAHQENPEEFAKWITALCGETVYKR